MTEEKVVMEDRVGNELENGGIDLNEVEEEEEERAALSESDLVKEEVSRVCVLEEESRVLDVSGEARKELDSKGGDGERVDDLVEGMELGTNENEESSQGREDEENRVSTQYDSLLSKFDDYVAGGLGKGVGTSRALSFGFKVGDMVWGKVKSHPWWPGHIFSEAFASPSVRRSRREGHVLVAFFGDSSYGWFDPAELVPFRQNFTEKSRQTNSRNLNKAVEDAIDEASRRCALGLACRCRKPDNFRPASVNGYFAVDVCDYEGVYSESQIQSSRDNFRSSETLAFIRQLASKPLGSDEGSLSLIENRARVFAYRKAVFEEFDETYAEAFGYPGDRPPRIAKESKEEPLKEPARAPLSGPLVIAESLGGKKGSTKAAKVKDQTKKDRYLFKRRDEKNDSKTLQVHEGKSGEPAPVVYVEEALTLAPGDYVLQKRAPAVSPNPQLPTEHEMAEDIKPKVEGDAKQSFDKDNGVKHENKDEMGVHFAAIPTSISGSNLSEKPVQDVSSFQQEGEATLHLKNESEMPKPSETSQQHKPNFTPAAEEYNGMDKVEDGQTGVHTIPTESKSSGIGKSKNVGIKKPKVVKRPIEDSSSEKSVQGEKKKKRKKEIASETISGQPKKLPAPGKGVATVGKVGKIKHKDLTSQDDSQSDYQKKDDTAILPNSLGSSQLIAMSDSDIKLPQLLSDLRALALDPFHGAERNGPAITRQFFLKFRSLVYQKSLVIPLTAETESADFQGNRSPVVMGNDNIKEPAAKKPRPLGRPDDPTRGGRKRAPSDRQEEIVTKKLKKIKDIKLLAAEKKTFLKNADSQKVEKKETSAVPPRTAKTDPTKKAQAQETSAPAPTKMARMDSTKKVQTPPPKTAVPTMLVVKFPPGSNLPSMPELKARFARFGPLDYKSMRVFWTSLTCRVVFHYKEDAHKAYRYAVGNNALFGNVNVRYYLRDAGGQEPEILEASGRGRGDDASMDLTNPRDSFVEQRLNAPLMQQPSVQLKSILKKSSGDEAGLQVSSSNGRASGRVKFVLGGEESGREDPLMMSSNRNINNASFGDGATSSVAMMDYNTKNFHKVIPPSSLPPILPLPPQFSKPPQNMHYNEVGPPPAPQPQVPPRVAHNYNPPPSSAPLDQPATSTIDISQQMINLLTRCNDVVANVKSFLGYVPYHPL